MKYTVKYIREMYQEIEAKDINAAAKWACAFAMEHKATKTKILGIEPLAPFAPMPPEGRMTLPEESEPVPEVRAA